MNKKELFDGFKKFILRGNVVDLAVGVVIGGAFGAVVNSFVRDLLTPFIAVLVKKPDFSRLHVTLRGAEFAYGDFLNSLLSFLLIGGAIYFFVVLPINSLVNRLHTEPPVEPHTKKCPECFSDIPQEARRCPFCTTPLAS